MIIDPAKREYEDLMKNLKKETYILDFSGDNFPRFNPFIPPANIKIYSHSTVLARSISILFPTNEVAYELILQMIRVTYIEKLKLKLKLEKVSLEEFLGLDGSYMRSHPDCIPTFNEFLNIGIQWFDVLINSSTKIIHRILYGVDKECLGQAMSLTQRETDYLSYLATGEAIAFTAEAYQPIYVTVPDFS